MEGAGTMPKQWFVLRVQSGREDTVKEALWRRIQTHDLESKLSTLMVPTEKVVINVEQFGNTTAATIPLALNTAIEDKRLKRGDLLLMVSVGAGFTVGALLLRWGLKEASSL